MLLNVNQDVGDAAMTTTWGPSTPDLEDNMDYFHRPGHLDELHSSPPKSPPKKKLRLGPMAVAPQHRLGMDLSVLVSVFFLWGLLIKSYIIHHRFMFVVKLVT